MKRNARTPYIVLLIVLLAGLLSTQSMGASTQSPTTIYLPVVKREIDSGTEWSTVAGNPQRTSAIKTSVTGNLHVEWYRPIQAYIPQNAQLIAAADQIFVTTSRGLYALNATSGNVNWQFDSDMPIGNSPTVQDNVVFFAGFDRKVHALNAYTGATIWEFSGAQAGYDTNPLVVEGKVILGNRDGNLYALDATTGALLWKYYVGSAIRYSAAYKDGVVYFAANDNSAYAVNIDGTLKWKSQKLPGDGFQSYWPVIYHDSAINQDLVVYSGSVGYRFDLGPGTLSVQCLDYGSTTNYVPCDSVRFYNDLIFGPNASATTPVGPTVQVSSSWGAGKTVMDYSKISSLFASRPWLRYYFVLNASDGTEYTYGNYNGKPGFAPIVPFGTNSGDVYPPVLGPDGMLYFNNLWQANQQGKAMAWRTGTPYVVMAGAQGDTGEPQALSIGGSTMYRSICCDRVGDWFDMTNTSSTGWAWHYISPLTQQAPGYDAMWWFLMPDFLYRLTGNYGGVNGIYHDHADQNPIVPYHGRIYIHRSNAIIAYGTNSGPGKLPLLAANPVPRITDTPTTADLTNRLTNEVSKMIAAGHLRPGYYNTSQFNVYPDLVNYFENPGSTIYTLAMAYPYVDPSIQPQLKAYLKQEFTTYFDSLPQGTPATPATMYSSIGWADGAARESMVLPPEVQADLANYPKQTSAWPNWLAQYPVFNLYAMYQYALVFPENAGHIYNDLAKPILTDPHFFNELLQGINPQIPPPPMYPSVTNYFLQKPYELNGYITGYIGFLKLQQLAGMDGVDTDLKNIVTTERDSLLNYRAQNFSKDTYYSQPVESVYTHRVLNLSRNFIMLSPELGDYLNQNALAKVTAAVNEYNDVGPYWFVSRYNASIGEGGMQNLYDTGAVFQAKAYILKASRAELTKYLDTPGFAVGDLFYIQNLVAALQAQ